jgi:arylsulfatase A-like enzyme/Flp pilus assembly protein TadD
LFRIVKHSAGLEKVNILFVLCLFLCVLLLIPFFSNQTAGAQTSHSSPSEDQKNYNVLLITIDTLRFDRLGIYSDNHVETPNIDELARKSIVFTRAFSHNPVTLPAHTNILTGTTPLYHGISDNTGFKLDESFLTLSEYLKGRGYETGAFIGAFPLDSRFGLDQGFDIYDDNYGTHSSLAMFFVERRAEEVIRPAREWLEDRDKPWFAWLHLFDPHQPYLPPAPFDQKYEHDLYSGEVAYIDSVLGPLFSMLEDKAMLENTIIVFTADHGEALGEKGEETHSYFAYNNTIHIPLIFYVPGMKHKMVEDNVCHVDIFPTLCQLLGGDMPNHLQGRSLFSSKTAKNKDHQDIYFESLTPYLNRSWAPLRGLIRENIKFIDLPIAEVYDLANDMDENLNLADRTDTEKLKKDLRQLMSRMFGPSLSRRTDRIDPEELKKLESLGYVAGGAQTLKETFSEKDDLKTLLPVQNRMLQALAKYQTGHIDESIVELQRVVEEKPDFILVYNRMATLYKETGRIQESISILKDGLDKNPGHPDLMSSLGIMLAEAGQPEEAVQWLEECLLLRDFDPEIFNYLGVAFYKMGQIQPALANYRRALELDNNYASVYNNIGSLYLRLFLQNKEQKAFDSAMLNFNRALVLDPRLFAAYNGRGAAYKFTGNVELAIADWKRAIELNPDFIDPYFNIGIAFLEKGDKSSALKYLLLCREKFSSRLPVGERQRLDRLIQEAQR